MHHYSAVRVAACQSHEETLDLHHRGCGQRFLCLSRPLLVSSRHCKHAQRQKKYIINLSYQRILSRNGQPTTIFYDVQLLQSDLVPCSGCSADSEGSGLNLRCAGSPCWSRSECEDKHPTLRTSPQSRPAAGRQTGSSRKAGGVCACVCVCVVQRINRYAQSHWAYLSADHALLKVLLQLEVKGE